MRKLAAVEGVETFPRAAAGRFLACTMCVPSHAVVAVNADAIMAAAGDLSLGGMYWRGEVAMVDLGVGAGGEAQDWEKVISRVAVGCVVAFSDGSRDECERVAGGWCDTRDGKGYELVGSVATVWDGEIAGMRLALEALPVVPLLLLCDSNAALAAVKNAAGMGKARTADWRAVVDMVWTWAKAGVELHFG